MVQFSSRILQEIKQRIPVSSVVGRFVALQSKGRGEFLGLCPFHKEKTPSFTVSDAKEFYYCFGCGAKGDIFKFLTEKEGKAFPEIVEELASQAGVVLPKLTQSDGSLKEKKDIYLPLYQAMEDACLFFQEKLSSNAGARAREYLHKRGFDQSIVTKFRMGFSLQGWHYLHEALKAKGYTDEQLVKVGLISKNDRGEYYDRFRGRVMFPIMDAKGRVVAFGGRELDGNEPKYLNSAETPLFHKGKLLYNYHLAKQEALDKEELIVTEGYVDAIALYKAGVKHVVATLGTAVTKDQVYLLWKLSKKPTFCFDGDNAGQRAMKRVAELAVPILTPGHTMQFAKLPNQYDPDDVITRLGVHTMRELLEKSEPLSEFVWQAESGAVNLRLPEQRAQLDRRLAHLSEQIEDKTVAGYYRQFFNQKLWQSGLDRKAKRSSFGSPAVRLTPQNTLIESNLHSIKGVDDVLTLLILMEPTLLRHEQVHDQWLSIDYEHSRLDILREIILEAFEAEEGLKSKELIKKLLELGHEQDVNYFKSLKNSVMSPIWSDSGDMLDVWRYFFERRHLAVLQEEYKQMLYQMTEEAMRRAMILKQEIEQVEQSIQRLEMAFGEMQG